MAEFTAVFRTYVESNLGVLFDQVHELKGIIESLKNDVEKIREDLDVLFVQFKEYSEEKGEDEVPVSKVIENLNSRIYMLELDVDGLIKGLYNI